MEFSKPKVTIDLEEYNDLLALRNLDTEKEKNVLLTGFAKLLSLISTNERDYILPHFTKALADMGYFMQYSVDPMSRASKLIFKPIGK